MIFFFFPKEDQEDESAAKIEEDEEIEEINEDNYDFEDDEDFAVGPNNGLRNKQQADEEYENSAVVLSNLPLGFNHEIPIKKVLFFQFLPSFFFPTF